MTSLKKACIVTLILVTCFSFVGCSAKQEELIEISVKVTATTILTKQDIDKKLSKESLQYLIEHQGVILDEQNITVNKSNGLAKILQNVFDSQGISHIVRQDFFGSYIESIFDISEKSFGSGSGWIYFVNGISPSVSVGSYNILPNDKVEIKYTCDMGNDL